MGRLPSGNVDVELLHVGFLILVFLLEGENVTFSRLFVIIIHIFFVKPI